MLVRECIVEKGLVMNDFVRVLDDAVGIEYEHRPGRSSDANHHALVVDFDAQHAAVGSLLGNGSVSRAQERARMTCASISYVLRCGIIDHRERRRQAIRIVKM